MMMRYEKIARPEIAGGQPPGASGANDTLRQQTVPPAVSDAFPAPPTARATEPGPLIPSGSIAPVTPLELPDPLKTALDGLAVFLLLTVGIGIVLSVPLCFFLLFLSGL